MREVQRLLQVHAAKECDEWCQHCSAAAALKRTRSWCRDAPLRPRTAAAADARLFVTIAVMQACAFEP